MTDNRAIAQEQLAQIKEGMDVFDANEDKIGEVKFVKLGDEDPQTPQSEVNDPATTTTTGIDELLGNLFVERDLPQTLQDRMLRLGYVRINGFTEPTRFATSDEVSRIADGNVYLKVVKNDLLTK